MNWFVSEMFKLEQLASECVKTIISLSRAKNCNGFVMSPDEEGQFEKSTTCWFCEDPFDSNTATLAPHTVKIRDHDHLTGNYREAAHKRCILICKQK